MQLDHSRGAPPLYLQIKEIIKERIKDGTYEHGANIPTEPDFQDKFGVSRITVRQAINELQIEGYVKRSRGKGTEVIYKKIIEEPLSYVKSFTDEITEKGMVPGTSFAKIEIMKPAKDIKEILELTDEDKVIKIMRVRTVDGKPFVNFITYIMFDERYPKDDQSYYGSLYKILEKTTGRKVSYVKEVIGAVLADQEMADLLNMKKNGPILKRVRLSYDMTNRPLEYSICYYKADSYSYTITLESKKD